MTDTYRGVPNTEFVWHGEWSDPEIKYGGMTVNYWEIEKWAWDEYVENCELHGDKPTEDGFDSMIKANPDMIYEMITTIGNTC